MATTADMLAEVPIFALLDENERGALADRVDIETHGKGKNLFMVGDPGDSLYVVRKGTVELFVTKDDGTKVVLETANQGDFFGEISLLDGGARNASAEVKSDCELIVVDRGDLDELFRIKPAAAMDLLAATGRRLRETSRLLRQSAAKNINEETEDNRSRVERIADWVADFSGSLEFLFIHIGIFFVWIVLNVAPLTNTRIGGFDPFPFGLLTMCVSLEAIVLSVLVLLSQNRQIARDRVRNEIEYQVNLSAEMKVAHLHEKVDHLQVEVLSRLSNLERAAGVKAAATPTAK